MTAPELDPNLDLSIRSLRDEVDDVDRRLIELLHRRARLVCAIASRKRALGLPAVDRERERAMSDSRARAPNDGLPERSLARVLNYTMREFRALARATATTEREGPDTRRSTSAT